MSKRHSEGLNQWVEVVVPFGNDLEAMGLDGLFDDCPLCQQLRRDLEAGKARREPLDRNPNDESGFRTV